MRIKSRKQSRNAGSQGGRPSKRLAVQIPLLNDIGKISHFHEICTVSLTDDNIEENTITPNSDGPGDPSITKTKPA